MQGIAKKRVTALVAGIGLILALLTVFWAAYPFFLTYWLFIPLILALIPMIVGGMVGVWIREGASWPWLRASGMGVVVWWLLLLVLFIAVFAWIGTETPAPSPSSSYDGGSHQPGYGEGLFLGALLFYGGAYAIVGLPFILLGAVITYPRRKGPREVRSEKRN